MEYLPFILAAVLVIAIRILAGQNHIFGRICRWFWNTSFKLCSIIPFMGWMTCFIIADTQEEKAVKSHYQGMGKEADDIAITAVNKKIEQDRREEEERQERIRLQDAINHALKRTDARIIGNDVVEIGGKKYTLESVKRKLGIS